MLVALLVVAAAVGASVLSVRIGGVTLYPFRLLVIAVLLATPMLQYRVSWLDESTPRLFVAVGFLWFVWGGLSVFWSPSFATGVEDVFAVGFGFAVGVALLILGTTQAVRLRWLRRGWVVAFLITGGIALWEIITGNHLPGDYVEQAPDYALQSIAISTFGNPNNYGAFLVICLPFLVVSSQKSRSRVVFIFFEVLILFLFFFLFMTGSRSALLGAVLEIGVLVLFFGAWKRGVAALVGVLSIVIGATYAGFSLRDLQLIVSLQEMVSEGAFEQGSLRVRLGLTLNGLWMLARTFGFGVGAGGYEIVSQRLDLPYYTGGLVNPHNFWIEVSSEYGIFVGMMFVGMMGIFFVRALREYLSNKSPWSKAALLVLVGYFFASLANSTYMAQPTNWMAISSVMCMVGYIEKKKERQSSSVK